MATITPLRPNRVFTQRRLIVFESKTTSGLQSSEGRKIAELAEEIAFIKEYIKSLENTEEIDYNSVPPKSSERVRMRSQFKGRGKPLPYPLDKE